MSVEAEYLIKHFGAIRAVDGVSLRVDPGEIVALLGPNGAGKSTTLKLLSGFLVPDGGHARIGGFDVARHPVEAKRRLGYLPENGPLYREMTVREFLSFIARVRELAGSEGETAVRRAVRSCHLESVLDQTIDTLSKGFRKRVGLAQAVVHSPACLLLDEPAEGLDPNQKRELRALIRGMAEDKAVLLSTHLLHEVPLVCDRVLVIDSGKLVADGTPADLLGHHPDAGAVDLVPAPGEPAPTGLETLGGVARSEVREGALRCWPASGADLVAILGAERAAGRLGAVQVQPVVVDFDDVFASLTHREPFRQ